MDQFPYRTFAFDLFETKTRAAMEDSAEIDVDVYGRQLLDKTAPMGARIRSIFYLKLAASSSSSAMDYLIQGIHDSSVLLAHECAYSLGQTQNPYGLPALRQVLEDRTLHPILRHEAGEGIGAIGFDGDLSLLQTYANDDAIEVAETCQIAIDRIRSGNRAVYDSRFESVDPAPSAEMPEGCSDSVEAVRIWGDMLRNEKLPLFDRYRAMFALRDDGSDEAVQELSASLSDRTSALFRHEVAYVLGQLQSPLSRNALTESLKDSSEHEMVRHEVAIALGAIANSETIELLKGFLNDPEDIVRESAEVALDLYKHWNEEGFSES